MRVCARDTEAICQAKQTNCFCAYKAGDDCAAVIVSMYKTYSIASYI